MRGERVVRPSTVVERTGARKGGRRGVECRGRRWRTPTGCARSVGSAVIPEWVI